MLRNRGQRDPLKVVRHFDAFPKVPEEYQSSSRIGGTRKQYNNYSNLTTTLILVTRIAINHIQYDHIYGNLFAVSVLSRALIIYFVYREVMFYMDSRLVFKFKPDTDMDQKLKIHIDVTVATPCSSKHRSPRYKLSFAVSLLTNLEYLIADIGADILDSTNQNVFSFGVLEEQDTWWELCPNQRTYFEYMQHLNQYLREEYHSLSVSCP